MLVVHKEYIEELNLGSHTIIACKSEGKNNPKRQAILKLLYCVCNLHETLVPSM